MLTVPPTVYPDLFPLSEVKDGYSSLEQNADAPMLSTSTLRKSLNKYEPDPSSRYVSPLILPDEELRGYPPTCFYVAGLDPLRDEGLLFEEKLRRVG